MKLTERDIERIKQSSNLFSEQSIQKKLAEIEAELDTFLVQHSDPGGCQSDDVRWFRLVMEYLADDTTLRIPAKSVSWDHPLTRDRVVDVMNTLMNETEQEHRDEFNEDPEGYRKWHTRSYSIENGHPMGDDNVAMIREWYTATVYEVWCVAKAVEDAAMDAVREHLIDLATGDRDADEIKDASARAYEKALKEVGDRLRWKIQRRKAEEQAQASWKGNPLEEKNA